MARNEYESRGEWSGFSVHEARTGWVIKLWSLVQGSRSGDVWLFPYSDRFPRGLDLGSAWNETMSMADAITMYADRKHAKCLRSGWIVQ